MRTRPSRFALFVARLHVAQIRQQTERSLNRASRSDYHAYLHVISRCDECGSQANDQRQHPRNHDFKKREITRWDEAVKQFVPIREHSDPKVRAWER